jgi:hypothetical protein
MNRIKKQNQNQPKEIILSEKDIDTSIENISASIKTEIENLNGIFISRHNELNNDTNNAILNLPLVKKIVWGYEEEIQQIKNSCSQNSCSCQNDVQKDQVKEIVVSQIQKNNENFEEIKIILKNNSNFFLAYKFSTNGIA